MPAAGPWSRDIVRLLSFVDGRDAGRRSNTQAFDVGSFAAGRKARPGHTNASVVEGSLVRHLSKTACVDAHDLSKVVYVQSRNKVVMPKNLDQNVDGCQV